MASIFAVNFDADFADVFTDFFEAATLNVTDHKNPQTITDTYDVSVIASSLAEIVHDETNRKKSSLAGRHFRFLLPDGVSNFDIKLEHDFILYNEQKWILQELVEGQSVGSKMVKYRATRGKVVNVGKDHMGQ